MFLAYTAFERFLKILDKNRATINTTLLQYDSSQKIRYILRQDDENKFYDFLYNHLQSDKPKLKAVYEQQSDNIIYIASSIRHIFAHGHLSANPNSCKPTVVKNICDCIFNFLITVMDDEFSKIINDYKDNLT